MEQRDQHDTTELVGRRWFVNLRSSTTFDTRPFADSVLVSKATPTYIIVHDYEDRIAIIPGVQSPFWEAPVASAITARPPKLEHYRRVGRNEQAIGSRVDQWPPLCSSSSRKASSSEISAGQP